MSKKKPEPLIVAPKHIPFAGIAERPTTVSPAVTRDFGGETHQSYHQSCFRAYGALLVACDLLRRGTPPDVVVEIVCELEPEMKR